MAKLTRKQLEEVVRREAPGYRVARPPADAADARQRASTDAAEDTTPDVEQARRKPPAAKRARPGTASDAGDLGNPGHSNPAPPADTSDDDQIVALEPETPVDPWDRGSRPKSIVVDGTGKVIGRQG